MPPCCPSLKDIQLIAVHGVGDAELRVLLEGCPSLRSLKLTCLDITEASAQMLMSRHPRIPVIAICDYGVSWDSILTLLREFTIPTIFNEDDPESQVSAIHALCYILANPYVADYHIQGILNSSFLLQRLAKLLATNPNESIRFTLMRFFGQLADRGYHRVLIDSGAISTAIRLTLERQLICVISFKLFASIAISGCRHELLSLGVLSLFRSQVSSVCLFCFVVFFTNFILGAVCICSV
jgi:hypothetical protein